VGFRIISRLLLNLRKNVQKGTAGSTSHTPTNDEWELSSPEFMSAVIGNIGEDFEHGRSVAGGYWGPSSPELALGGHEDVALKPLGRSQMT
jgi:hypothetical protein